MCIRDSTLGDVVVTGYQELERRKLTAAIAKVDVTDGMVGAAKSIDQALAGQIAGVAVTTTSGAPGAPARIRIRGTASLNGTQDPLWVLAVSYTHLMFRFHKKRHRRIGLSLNVRKIIFSVICELIKMCIRDRWSTRPPRLLY